MPPKVLI